MKAKRLILFVFLVLVLAGCSEKQCDYTHEDILDIKEFQTERRSERDARFIEFIEDFNVTIPQCVRGGELRKWCIGDSWDPNSTLYYCWDHPSGWQCSSIVHFIEMNFTDNT